MTQLTLTSVTIGATWPMGTLSMSSRRGGTTMITFLTWWTIAAIVAGFGLIAVVVHLNYREH